jgi:hypothetical protein
MPPLVAYPKAPYIRGKDCEACPLLSFYSKFLLIARSIGARSSTPHIPTHFLLLPSPLVRSMGWMQNKNMVVSGLGTGIPLCDFFFIFLSAAFLFIFPPSLPKPVPSVFHNLALTLPPIWRHYSGTIR